MADFKKHRWLGRPALKIWEVNSMLITGTEGFLPIQKNTARPSATAGTDRGRKQDCYYDHFSFSAPGERESLRYREAVSHLSRQVRTSTTTGKIQELRRQVSSGEYQIAPRAVAANILLMEEGE